MTTMATRYLSGCAAILALAFHSLMGCDVPPEAMPSAKAAEIRDSPLEGLYIESITTGGTGCPAADPFSVETVFSDDKKSFSVIYNDMELTYPPGPKIKNLGCQIGIKFHIPEGYQIALATTTVRAYLHLDAKIKARVTSSYFFAGVHLGTIANIAIVGPYDDFYELSDKIPFEALVWSDCGTSAMVGINTTLSLNAKNNPDGMAIIDATEPFPTPLSWQIRAC